LFKESSKFFLPEGIKNAVLTKKKDTIFHFHGGFISQFILIALFLRKKGFNYVFTPHGSYNTIAMERSNWKKKLYIFLFEKTFVQKARAIHFIGESEIDGAKRLFQLPNYYLVPNGQNIEEIEIPNIPKTKNRFPIFGFCGRLDIKTKGLDLLLTGFAQYLENRDGKGELWLMGDGQERDQLEALAQKLSITNQVKFLGSLYGKQKIEAMYQFDYLFLTSRNEGLPGVVLEAAAMRIPCVVSKETNMGTYINQNKAGTVLPENNAHEISYAMQNAMIWNHNGYLKNLQQNANSMIVNHFNWETIALKLNQLYA
jgi:glycosyltransferase involved in cell wall biosynthesis